MCAKIVVLDAMTLGDDLDLTALNNFGSVEIYDSTLESQILERASQAQVIVTNKVKISAEHLQQLPQLKGIAVCATGMDNIAVEAAEQRGVLVLNAKGYAAQSVAEHTLAMVLSLSHRLNQHQAWIQNGNYAKSANFTCLNFPFETLQNKTWGIIGLGDIGSATAGIAQAMGAKVVYHSTSGQNLHSHYQHLGLCELLQQSQIVTLHCPLNSKTHHLLGETQLQLLSPGAILVNVARGAIIDESALVKVVTQKDLRIGLDVFSIEPLPLNSDLMKLATLPNVLMTPHVAWAAKSARESLMQMVAENVATILAS